MSVRKPALVTSLVAAAAGCSGGLDGTEAAPGAAVPTVGAGVAPPGVTPTPGVPEPGVVDPGVPMVDDNGNVTIPVEGGAECTGGRLMPSRLWRLNDRQFVNAVGDLLPGITVPNVNTAGRDDHEFISVEGRYLIDDVFVNQLQGVVENIAEQAGAQFQALSGCAAADSACAESFSQAFAERAYRRPLEAAETAAVSALFAAGSDAADGFSLTVEGVLQSPSFLYRTELGAPGVATGSTRLTGYELASSLSFFFLDSIPDAELIQAAATGALDTEAGLAAQVDRLMADEGVQYHLTELFVSWLELPAIMGIEKDEDLIDVAFDAAGRESILEEARSFVHQILWTGGSVSDLLTSRQSWATGVAAEVLGVPESTGLPVELPATERAGLLTRPAMVAAVASGENQVVYRGRIMREVFLCGVVPEPPVDLDVDVINNNLEGVNERERMGLRAADPACAGCHAFMDPLGISFEVFGHVGEFLPGGVDASGELTMTDVNGPFTSIIDMSERLAESETVRQCVSQQMLSYAVGQYLDTAQDQCMKEQVLASIATPTMPLKDVFKGIATSTAFTTRIQGAAQ